MPGVIRRRPFLHATVAVAAMGAVVLAPAAPLAQDLRGAVLDPVVIRIGANEAFTRVEFAGVVGGRSQVRREGQDVIVRIGTTAAPDVSRLKVDPPKGVEKVETRAVAGGTEVVMTLAANADVRSGTSDGAVYVNLYGQAPEPGPGQTVKPAEVTVAARTAPGVVALDFAWPQAVGAAVFRRGEAVWVVFDRPAVLKLPDARVLGAGLDARWTAGPDHVALRIAAPKSMPVAASEADGKWTVTIGGAPAEVEGVSVDRDETGRPALVARMAGAGKAIWLTDPVAGDRFAAVTALAPGKGFSGTRRTVELSLIPTAHGLAVETPVEDLAIKADGDLVTLTRPKGLTLSEPTAGLEAAAPVSGGPVKAKHPSLILTNWAATEEGGFGAKQRELQDAAAEEAMTAGEDPRAPIEARMRLARFLVGSGLHYEAIGVLNGIVAKAPGMGGEPEVRGLRGAARASIGRMEEAEADFAAAAVAGDPAAALWRGYIAAEKADWTAARQAFAQGASAIDDFPPEWRAKFGAAHAQAAVETGDLAAANTLLDYVFSQETRPGVQLAGRLVQAKLFELEGEGDRALAVCKAVARAPRDDLAAPADLCATRLALAAGTITPLVAAKQMESLRWRWRGDRTELEVIRELGRLYLSQGLYREALTALKGAGPKLANLPGAAEIQTDLTNAFRALFLEGGADGLEPVQALGLFYDFRELTPIGADGDEMVRRLARRLVDVDLLDQAAELLKHQVDTRLDGVAKAQVATDLATVYLMDRQPEKALEAIWQSRTTLLPSALNAERRALEARSLAALGRYDHALEILGTDQSADARAVRADVYWKQEKWAEAAALYEAMLGARAKDPAPLTPDEEAKVIRAGVGYTLAKNVAALRRMSAAYSPYIAGARSKAALQIALDVTPEGDVSPASFAALTASADTFNGWVAEVKTELRQKTGGNRPAAPARPQAAAAAPPARPAA